MPGYYTKENGDLQKEMIRPRVLIIDDDVEFLEVMKSFLQDIVDVEIAVGGRQAIQLVQETHVDLILLDFEMPVMDGMKTLTYLRNLKECINVPVIMLTGRRDQYAVTNSLVMGIDGYLLKPVSKDMLIETVTKTLEKRSEKGEKKIVVAIDDDMSYLKQLNSFLKDKYHVIMINSARLAFNYLSNHEPDIILLDYQIPLYNGVTLMKMLEQNSLCQNKPIIILSGTLDQEAIKELYIHKPAAVLAKPVSQKILLEQIQQALSTSQEEL